MGLLLTSAENQQLFHRIRRGPMFPQVLLATENSSGLHSGWARCCGFNLAQGRLFCLPLHSHFSLERESQTGTLVMACPESQLSLHFWGQICTLRDPKLAPHFWEKLQPIVDSLNLHREQLLEFEVEEMRADRFCAEDLVT